MKLNLKKIIKEAKKYNSKIAYDELEDIRIQKAIKELKKEGFNPVLVGKRETLDKYFKKELEKYDYFVCPKAYDDVTNYSSELLSKGLVDATISGAINSTAHTLRPLIKNVGTKKGVTKISSFFLMITKIGSFIFSDCAVLPNPNEKELAEIAYLSAKSALSLGFKEAKVALLSFSTHASAKDKSVEKVISATKIAKQLLKQEEEKTGEKLPIVFEGELQLDSAIVPSVAELKTKKDSLIKGDANVLIFPDLNSGNIGYKLVQRFSDAKAIGPIIQGLNKPGNDLSRGCNVEDIKTLHAITVMQVAQDKK